MGRHDSSPEEDERDKKRDKRRRQRHSDSHRDKRREKEEQSEVAKPNVPKLNPSDNNAKVEDKSSVEYQRLTWDALRTSINELVNKVNARNIENIIPQLFSENLIRGRGLFCRSCINSQMASPEFTDVFAALVAVVNSEFPQIGLLLLKRLVLLLMIAYTLNDKPRVLAAAKFIAHLVNQQVSEEIIALEFIILFLEDANDDSVEVAVVFVKECGARLQEVSPKGLNGIFERFRSILQEGEIDNRVQYLIQGLYFAKFPRHPAVRPELDLVEENYSHDVLLDQDIDPETSLDVFKPDPDFLENEKKYEELKKELLAEEEDDGYDASSEDKDEFDEEEMRIRDETTKTNLVNLRRTIYQTVDFEEAGHKLLQIKLEPSQEMELCTMLLECLSQERTYLRHYGLLGQRMCMINKIYKDNFEKCFVQKYLMIDRLETNKLRNVAKFFGHLLAEKALPWQVFSYIRLPKDDTTSSSRIFIKYLFEDLSENLGIRLLAKRLQDLTKQESLESNMKFSINFFTSIGLGNITENLGEYLKNMKQRMQVGESESGSSSGSDDSFESESDSESDSSSSDSESDSCSSDSESDSCSSDSESDSCSSDSESDSCSSDSESDSSSSSSDESDKEKSKRRRRN